MQWWQQSAQDATEKAEVRIKGKEGTFFPFFLQRWWKATDIWVSEFSKQEMECCSSSSSSTITCIPINQSKQAGWGRQAMAWDGSWWRLGRFAGLGSQWRSTRRERWRWGGSRPRRGHVRRGGEQRHHSPAKTATFPPPLLFLLTVNFFFCMVKNDNFVSWAHKEIYLLQKLGQLISMMTH